MRKEEISWRNLHLRPLIQKRYRFEVNEREKTLWYSLNWQKIGEAEENQTQENILSHFILRIILDIIWVTKNVSWSV